MLAIVCIPALCLLATAIPVSALDGQRRPVMQLEIEEVTLEDSDSSFEEDDYLVEPPTPTPEPAVFSILTEVEREAFEQTGTVIRRTLPFSQDTLIVGAGFTPSDFIFTEKKPSVPLELEGSLSVFANQPFSYQTVALQQDVLKTLTGAEIASVACDVTNTPCTPTTPGQWTLAQTYGFGYRVGTQSLYKPFPVRSNGDPAVLVTSQSYLTQPFATPFFVKLNLPPSFQEGTYVSELLMITLPKP